MTALRTLLLAAVAALAAAADLTEPATIERTDGNVMEVHVLLETLDEVLYRFKPDDQVEPQKLRRQLVATIRYGTTPDIDLNRGRGALARGEQEKALTAFVAAHKSPYFRAREESYVLAADVLRALKRHDEAVKEIAALQAAAPRSSFLPRAVELRVRVLLEKGDRPAAEKAIAELATIDAGRAALARAELIRSSDPAAAAKELQAAWALVPRTVDDGRAPWDEVGFQLVADLQAAKQPPQAIEALQRLCYGAVLAGNRVKAHLALARALGEASDTPTLLRALDHALMAGALPSADKGGARKAANAILTKLDKDPALKNDAAEYRQYLNSL